jgi:hypothetical protein
MTGKRYIKPKLPLSGSVLGVDVGYSSTRRSGAVCRLDWTEACVTWTIRRFRAITSEREQVLTAVAGDVVLQAAAFDGPLRTGLDVIGRYRAAERMLTRRLNSKIGKPGQASTSVGKRLNEAANICAKIVRSQCRLAPAVHATRIDQLAIVEAFPSTFLGLLLADPRSVRASRGNRSDVFFRNLSTSGKLQELMNYLLPGRTIDSDLTSVVNHDDRAALVCAFTALCVAADDFVAVGDRDGWIVLPPRSAIHAWAISDLKANAEAEQLLIYMHPGAKSKASRARVTMKRSAAAFRPS